MVSTGMYEVQEASRRMTRTPLKSGSNPNANDIVGKPLGFGDVMFAQDEVAPVIPLFAAPAPVQVALAA